MALVGRGLKAKSSPQLCDCNRGAEGSSLFGVLARSNAEVVNHHPHRPRGIQFPCDRPPSEYHQLLANTANVCFGGKAVTHMFSRGKRNLNGSAVLVKLWRTRWVNLKQF